MAIRVYYCDLDLTLRDSVRRCWKSEAQDIYLDNVGPLHGAKDSIVTQSAMSIHPTHLGRLVPMKFSGKQQWRHEKDGTCARGRRSPT